ncbi:MAG: tRNA (adenosine(37)-N6)-threonylcarbamoyltransferase complex dimerization subunit type 1 TsaB [Blastocatellia bacterium]|nr:tRNA (adenosine(37)-N6)-threonylcarbamoyltransferase complex dimerization subunit type 1 TsaB [Blastocatellia bacterium]
MDATTSPNPLILTLDTASIRLSIALTQGSHVRAVWGVTTAQGAAIIIQDIDLLLNRMGTKPAELTAVGVITGPGSFTGVRIGLATMKGMAHALNCRVVTATTLEVIAAAIPHFFPVSYVCAIQAAHREEVFVQLFECQAGAFPQPLASPRTGLKTVVVAEAVALFMHLRPAASVLFFSGDALEGVKELLQELATRYGCFIQTGFSAGKEGWFLVSPPTFLAPVAGPFLFEKWRAGLHLASAEVEACYIRQSDAEVKLGTLQG